LGEKGKELSRKKKTVRNRKREKISINKKRSMGKKVRKKGEIEMRKKRAHREQGDHKAAPSRRETPKGFGSKKRSATGKNIGK